MTQPVAAAQFGKRAQKIPEPLYPVNPVIASQHIDEVYPSVAGDFLVYSQRKKNQYSVVRVSRVTPSTIGREIKPDLPKEAIRFGVALQDGAIGYISNRMGPIGAWMRQAHGDGHIAIANMGTFTHALMPANLKASANGRVWCFDTSLEKTRRAKVLDDYSDGFMHEELVGQTWRMYSSDAFRYKAGYAATAPGNVSKFFPPSLFIFDRKSSQLMMIPNALNGAVSPDGKRIVFVRVTGGNYDLWLQNVDGGSLTQLTSTRFGEFEPAWSPDGSKIAFISNRDSKGDVRLTSVYTMDLKTNRVIRLTNAPKATDGGPAWKDTKTVLFHSNRNPKKPQAATISEWNIWQVRLPH
ncbi:MAG: TolB family protein [Mariprofundaceae bacterium]